MFAAIEERGYARRRAGIARRSNVHITPGPMRLTAADRGTHMDAVPAFDKADYSLHAVKLGQWEGFIFVNLAMKTPALDEAFAPLAGKFGHWNLPLLRSARRIEYDVCANWKLIFENYSECYHCPGVHPALAKIRPMIRRRTIFARGRFSAGLWRSPRAASLTMSGEACALPVGDIEGGITPCFLLLHFPKLLLRPS